MPDGEEEASKFLREAVRTYPELYFARFVVLGEGASEEVVLPRLAEALDLPIDRSFVAIVPLGGRHVNHLWKLLNDLAIPHATLLDLDWGREGGGWGRIKTTCEQLLAISRTPEEVFGSALRPEGPDANLAAFVASDAADAKSLDGWVAWLRKFGVFFSVPLDLDYAMLRAFPEPYKVLEPGRRGPTAGDARKAVLGDEGFPTIYGAEHDEALRWYRYLFLGRGKPSTHVRVLGPIEPATLKGGMPAELRALLDHITAALAITPSGRAS